MNIEKYSRKSHNYNEDRYLIGNNIIGVLDGATPLNKNTYTVSPASILVKEIKKAILSYKGSNITDLLNNLSISLYKNNTLHDSSCGLIIAVFHEKFIDLYNLGDCEAAIIYKNNKIEKFVSYELINLDNIALEKMKEIAREKSISIKAAKNDIIDTLKYHRSLKNKDNGYQIFEPLDNPNFTPKHLRININDLKFLYLYSDGFASAYTTYKIYDSFDSMFKNNLNINDVINNIVLKAKTDKDYNTYPRFKLIDDITAVKITF